jgi:imidazolonepropionase-like amidohydrolase
MKTTPLVVAISLLTSFFCCTEAEKADIAIQNVTIIDATGASERPGMTVLIAGSHILRIGRTQKTKLAKDVSIVDGSGKYLIPGLWDMHIHPFEGQDIRWKEFMALYIANGITSVRVMFGEPKFHQWREEISSGQLTGPRMIIASPRPPEFTNAEQGRQFVQKSKAEGADFIKILSDDLPRDVYYAIADEAKKQGIPFAGHVPYSVSAAEASDAGQLSLEHKYAVLIPCDEREEMIRKKLMNIGDFRDRVKALADIRYDEQKARHLFSRLLGNGTFLCPTLVVWNDPAYRDKAEMANDPRLAFFPSELKNWFKNMGDRLIDDEVVAGLQRICLSSRELVGAMNRAGIKILAGTDSGSVPFVLQGFSLHDELQLLVESGLSPLEAIQTATKNASECVGKQDSLGTIEEGKIADLILLEGNPLSSIANTRIINSVFFNGRYFDRQKLDTILNKLRKLGTEM